MNDLAEQHIVARVRQALAGHTGLARTVGRAGTGRAVRLVGTRCPVRGFRKAGMVAIIVVVTLGGCAPSISPLYRDYDVREGDGSVRERILRAVALTRWKVVPTDAPHVIATDTVTVRRWGLYRVEVALEFAPIGEDHVRVFVHAYRHYFTGARRKIPYFKRRLRRTILPELQKAFEAQGVYAIGFEAGPGPKGS